MKNSVKRLTAGNIVCAIFLAAILVLAVPVNSFGSASFEGRTWYESITDGSLSINGSGQLVWIPIHDRTVYVYLGEHALTNVGDSATVNWMWRSTGDEITACNTYGCEDEDNCAFDDDVTCLAGTGDFRVGMFDSNNKGIITSDGFESCGENSKFRGYLGYHWRFEPHICQGLRFTQDSGESHTNLSMWKRDDPFLSDNCGANLMGDCGGVCPDDSDPRPNSRKYGPLAACFDLALDGWAPFSMKVEKVSTGLKTTFSFNGESFNYTDTESTNKPAKIDVFAIHFSNARPYDYVMLDIVDEEPEPPSGPPTYHWKLDETSGTTVYDAQGLLDITNNGATIDQAGPEAGDKSYLFNDTTDKLSTGSTTLVPETADWSVEVTFKTTYSHPGGDPTDQGHLFGNNDGVDTNRGAMYIQDGILSYWQKNGPVMSGGSNLDDGDWHTAGVMRNGSSWGLVLNGNVISTATYSGNMGQSTEWVIGHASGSSANPYDFQGYISDVKLWDSTIKPLTHRWKLDETSGTTAYDDIGDLDITNNGAVVNQSGPTAGDLSYLFNDTTDKLSTGSTTLVPQTYDWSVTVTFKTTYSHPGGDPTDQGHLFGNNDGVDTNRGAMYIQDGKLAYWQKNGPSITDSQAVNVADGNWHTATIERNGSTFTLYRDGNVAGTATYAGNMGQATEWIIGHASGSSTNPYDFQGYISDVQFWAETPAWTEIINDDFESGFGNWNDGGTDCVRSNDAGFAHQGTYAIKLRDNTSSSVMTTDNLSLSGYTEINVDFWFKADSMDSGEDFWLQISTDGGTNFTTVKDWDSGDEFVNGQFYHESVDITGYSLNNTTQLRFRCDASADDDEVYIDEVKVSAR